MNVTDPFPSTIQTLQNSQLFHGLSPADLHAVCNLAGHRRIEPGGFFFHQDDPATTLFLLMRGQIKMTQIGPEGHQVLVRFVNAGEGFGAIAAMSGMTYPLSAQAVEECVAVSWDELTLKQILSTYPVITHNVLQLVTSYFKQLQERYRELATERVERRVARSLLRLVEQAGRPVERGVLIDLSLSRQDLAEMTGTTLYTVSRILSGWERAGLVDVGRGRVMIRRLPGLEAIAEDLTPRPLPTCSN
jgi:CRP-like cAMP-binding protein